MARFYGNHPGTRQNRGRHRVKPATPEERLASMQRELERREQVFGPDDPYTQMQREVIAKEEGANMEINCWDGEVALICSYCTAYVAFSSVEELREHIEETHNLQREAIAKEKEAKP